METQAFPQNTAHPALQAEAILRAWRPFQAAMGAIPIRTPAEYEKACATLNVLIDEVQDDETHPLAEVLDLLGDQMRDYESRSVQIPSSSSREILAYLMEEHGLKQSDLADCATQSRISEILGGKRAISKAIAARLAARFKVSIALFLRP